MCACFLNFLRKQQARKDSKMCRGRMLDDSHLKSSPFSTISSSYALTPCSSDYPHHWPQKYSTIKFKLMSWAAQNKALTHSIYYASIVAAAIYFLLITSPQLSHPIILLLLSHPVAFNEAERGNLTGCHHSSSAQWTICCAMFSKRRLGVPNTANLHRLYLACFAGLAGLAE